MILLTTTCAALAMAPTPMPAHSTLADILVPTKFAVLLGKPKGGNLHSLAADDGDPLTVCHWFIPNIVGPFLRLRLTFGPTHKNPSELTAIVKARAVEAGLYEFQIWQRDMRTHGFVNTLSHTRLSTQYTVFTGEATGDLSRFVDQDTGETEFEVQIWRVGPFAVYWPCMDFEYTWQSVSE